MGRALAAVYAVVLVACSGDTADTLTTTTTTTLATSTTTSVATTTSSVPVVGVDEIALHVVTDEVGAGWVEELFIPYGDAVELLGTSPGGEGGTLDLGPEYGAQAPDGTWWFLDAAKTRLARYAADGSYLGEVILPVEVLVGGVYFQFQLPRVMADGTLIAFGFREEGTAILRATTDGTVDQIVVPGTLLPRVDDGMLVYMYTSEFNIAALDPITGSTSVIDRYAGELRLYTQTGIPFWLELGSDGLRLRLPDIGVDRILPIVTASDPTLAAFGSIEVTTTADGRIHLLMLGASEADETTQLGGFFSILPDGTVTPVVTVRNPFSPSDPGSPAHLGAAFGATQPWYMIVDTDGIHVYRRTG